MKNGRIDKQHIVLIGGGFAGLNFLKELHNNRYYRITLIDKNNYNYFTPLLYQVATGFLEPASISYPFRKLLQGTDIRFRMATVKSVDTVSQRVLLNDGGSIGYDILVFAAGTKTNFFGNRDIQQNASSLKGIGDALHLRNELIRVLESASQEKDLTERRKKLTVVIAGGGPTGVEVAGMLAEMKESIIKREYPELKNETLSVYVIDGAPVLLTAMSDKTHTAAYKILKRIGVNIVLNAQVLRYEDDVVYLSNGQTIQTQTLIWAAGVVANKFNGIAKTSLGRGNRMATDEYGLVVGYENVYAIGDIGIQHGDSRYPNGHPQLAQPAIQQGRTLAKNLIRLAKRKTLKPFSYFDRGDMAIIGRKYAVADLFKHRLHLGGLLGLLSWLFIHLISLVSYNNKIKTLYSWAVAYLTADQSLRMIFKAGKNEHHDERSKIEEFHEV
ncbi:MAG TPA: NAD(P)/FAD-dependent oxidoreductase [Ohtaekwangia sp.]|nr:NAD(P)/FAD-dependent oxidoreductase [Ohtaekwangia sp.]